MVRYRLNCPIVKVTDIAQRGLKLGIKESLRQRLRRHIEVMVELESHGWAEDKGETDRELVRRGRAEVTRVEPSWMHTKVVVLALALVMALASTAIAGPTATMASRQGDNTVYLTWDADNGKITEATSSRRFTADQEVELLTQVRARDGRLRVRGVLRNISATERYSVNGRLVQTIYKGTEVFRSRTLYRIKEVLVPGERIVASFSYNLPSGSYSIRTDFVHN